MKKIRVVVVIAGLVAAMGATVACGNGDERSPTGMGMTAQVSGAASPAGIFDVSTVRAVEPGIVAGRSTASLRLQAGSEQAGIVVTGRGILTLKPDLALLDIGVETTAKTVAQAREEAAVAMDAVMSSLRALAVDDKDIQTRFYNISPQYEFEEVVKLGRRSTKRVLIGYTVNNSASIKIRDLDTVGLIVDEAANAGGDAIRIDGISFTVEYPKPFMKKLREMAVADALATAQQFASLTGVSAGELVFIAETNESAQSLTPFQGNLRFALAEASPQTMSSLSGGELQLSMTVQAIFSIR